MAERFKAYETKEISSAAVPSKLSDGTGTNPKSIDTQKSNLNSKYKAAETSMNNVITALNKFNKEASSGKLAGTITKGIKNSKKLMVKKRDHMKSRRTALNNGISNETKIQAQAAADGALLDVIQTMLNGSNISDAERKALTSAQSNLSTRIKSTGYAVASVTSVKAVTTISSNKTITPSATTAAESTPAAATESEPTNEAATESETASTETETASTETAAEPTNEAATESETTETETPAETTNEAATESETTETANEAATESETTETANDTDTFTAEEQAQYEAEQAQYEAELNSEYMSDSFASSESVSTDNMSTETVSADTSVTDTPTQETTIENSTE